MTQPTKGAHPRVRPLKNTTNTMNNGFQIGFGGIVPTTFNTKGTHGNRQPSFCGFGSIAATDLMSTNFAPGLKFKGEWLDFIGEPERNFYMVISSPPGHGKTTFCLKFANYLAQNFGRVIFFENEMNQSRTKRIFEFLGESVSSRLDLNFDSDSPASIERVLKSGCYDFAFFDSIQMSNLDEKELWKMKKDLFPEMGFVAISFANQKGGVRGSIVKQHQGDITVVFKSPGIATTTKNRFGEVGKEFEVF